MAIYTEDKITMYTPNLFEGKRNTLFFFFYIDITLFILILRNEKLSASYFHTPYRHQNTCFYDGVDIRTLAFMIGLNLKLPYYQKLNFLFHEMFGK